MTGQIIISASANTPSGFLPCDGSAIDRTTYANLFSEIGTTYGVGDGSTTFNVPDLNGKVPLGSGNISVGVSGGNENHSLATNELPSHSHDINAVTANANSRNPTGKNLASVQGTATNIYSNGAVDTTLGATSNVGSGASFSLMQPYLSLSFYVEF